MLGSVLIANRGEIARRIARTARRLGVGVIAVYSDADARALHVREADAAVRIGPAPGAESYLRGAAIIAAAKESRAEAIHPGYGFLSENADFAEAVIAAGLIWIGPRPHAIRAMGRKDAAKKLMAEAGVPVTPGYHGEDQSEARLAKEAEALGFPVLIKAVAGGGGKGMRKVEKKSEFKAALASAKREAANAFGDDRVLLETYVTRPRHIEVQVFGDSHGDVVHMFERDCSLQRRHQKVIEEAPAPGMDEATREAVCAAAVRAAQAVNYVSAGTVEFIADAREGLRADRIWFMEMNTRLQVEHPVTEEITGLDLVEWQLRVASGEKLPLAQDEIRMSGHAIEARLYAENPEIGFLPSTGALETFELPKALRVETGARRDDEVSPHYDPMIAKLIAHGETRADAIAALRGGCGEACVWPVRTNAGFLVRCLDDEAFRRGDADVGLVERRGAELSARPQIEDKLIELAASAVLRSWRWPRDWAGARVRDEPTPWQKLQGFRLNAAPSPRVWFRKGDEAVAVAPSNRPDGRPMVRDDRVVLFRFGDVYEFELDTGEVAGGELAAADGAVRAPMPGKIAAVAVKEGAQVKAGAPLVVLEAMKMEHALVAPFDGKVVELAAAPGAQVSEGALLARLEAV